MSDFPVYTDPNLPELAEDAQPLAYGDWSHHAKPQFHEDWFADWMCDILAGYAREVFDLDGMLVEIGSWEGKSTIALANAMWPQQIHAVDTWKGSLGEISWDLAKQRDVYKTFTGNIAAGTRGNVIVHRMGWRRWFHDVEGPIRFCFIDAEHSYKEVRENIEAALPRMVAGGILCGDDVHHPPVQRAVMDTVGNAQVHGTMWIHRVAR